jgi:hypothetical protein
MDETEKPKPMGQVIQIDEARIRDHLGEMVRGTFEEDLNAMLTGFAARASTNAPQAARTRGQAVTSGRWTPRPGR